MVSFPETYIDPNFEMFLCLTRFARYYEKGGKLHRTLIKAYGIRYMVLVYGQVCYQGDK